MCRASNLRCTFVGYALTLVEVEDGGADGHDLGGRGGGGGEEVSLSLSRTHRKTHITLTHTHLVVDTCQPASPPPAKPTPSPVCHSPTPYPRSHPPTPYPRPNSLAPLNHSSPSHPSRASKPPIPLVSLKFSRLPQTLPATASLKPCLLQPC